MSQNSLKEQALLERIGELVTGYENKVADLRVELTNYVNKVKELEEAMKDKTAEMVPPEKAAKE